MLRRPVQGGALIAAKATTADAQGNAGTAVAIARIARPWAARLPGIRPRLLPQKQLQRVHTGRRSAAVAFALTTRTPPTNHTETAHVPGQLRPASHAPPDAPLLSRLMAAAHRAGQVPRPSVHTPHAPPAYGSFLMPITWSTGMKPILRLSLLLLRLSPSTNTWSSGTTHFRSETNCIVSFKYGSSSTSPFR